MATKLTDEEKTQREELKAEKEANKPPKHQAKLERARANLPVMAPVAQEMFDTLVNDYTPEHLETLSAHLAFHVRELQTRNAVGTTVEVGQMVRIKSGNVRYIGQVGEVTRAQRIRCYVTIPGVDKEIYLFTSDVVPVPVETVEMNDDETANDVSDDDDVQEAVAV